MVPEFFQGTGMPDPGWWEALWPEPAKTIARLGIRPGMTVIDLCSGDGWFTLQIARIARTVVAIDIDGKLLAAARVRLEEAGIANCRFVEGDAYDVATLAGVTADFVFLANVFHGVSDKPRLARAIHAALKPGGRLAIVNWHARARETTTVLGEPRGPATALRLGPEATTQAVEPSGFRLLEIVEVSPHHYGAVFQRG